MDKKKKKSKISKIIQFTLGISITVFIIGFLVFGYILPETYIYLVRQVPKSYLNEIRVLGLIENDEKIKYLYTDATFDIKEGVYFVTNKNLILYCEEWEEPGTIIDFKNITAGARFSQFFTLFCL